MGRAWLPVAMGFAVFTFGSADLQGQAERVLAEWKFNSQTRWGGWNPNSLIRNAAFDEDGVTFDSHGSDPIIIGPQFNLPQATNAQWVVIDMDCPDGGFGELYYTNKATGQYGGFEPKWREVVAVAPGLEQSVVVWPFWSSLGKIIRLRFDPPVGKGIRLRSIRVVEFADQAPRPNWRFDGDEHSWRSLYGAELKSTGRGLSVRAHQPLAMIISPVEPFEAERNSILRFKASCPGEDSIALYWAGSEGQGLFGRPLPLPESESPKMVDLRQWPEWKGSITHLAIAFGSRGGEELTLEEFSIEPNDPQESYLRTRYFGFDRGVVRPDQQADLRIILEHAGGPGLPAGKAQIRCDSDEISIDSPAQVPVPAIPPGSRVDLRVGITAGKPGTPMVKLELPNGQRLENKLRIHDRVDTEFLARPDRYDVPPPRPVKTDYDIGIYYFPGWSAEQMSRWEKQADWPERDSLLGWYEEGLPEVADWHVKWAVENGISFFIYDWYWRDGKETLGAGLNQGFLQARYNQLMKFAIMWANHRPYSQHTQEQLLTVTDYWIEHYFRRPNYLTVDGKPYVSFFSTFDLIGDMGSEQAVKAAFEAMREKARQAGLPGIHFAACTGPDASALESLREAGFDSVTAYNYVQVDTTLAQSPYRHYMLGHENIWKRMHKAGTLPYVPLLTVNWDARPWHGPRTNQKFDRRTTYFAEGLERLKAHLDRTGQKMAILEAWNEWGEGSYLEPNAEFGFNDVEAVRQVFASDEDSWPPNVGPADVGLHGKYDMRGKHSGKSD